MPRTFLLPAVLAVGVLTAVGIGIPQTAGAMTPVDTITTAAPTADPTATPVADPTATATPSATPTAAPSAAPTAAPTASSLPSPTASPSTSAVPVPSPRPTARPTVRPAPRPKHFAAAPRPRITGTHRVGSKLHASVGSWRPRATTVHLQWRRDGHAIAHAVHGTYTLRKSDTGHHVSVRVVGARHGYVPATRTSGSVLVLKKKVHVVAHPSCDPNYSGCVPIASDVDCAGGSGNGPAYVQGPVRVLKDDIDGLDYDHDGIGCE